MWTLIRVKFGPYQSCVRALWPGVNSSDDVNVSISLKFHLFPPRSLKFLSRCRFFNKKWEYHTHSSVLIHFLFSKSKENKLGKKFSTACFFSGRERGWIKPHNVAKDTRCVSSFSVMISNGNAHYSQGRSLEVHKPLIETKTPFRMCPDNQ